DLGERLGCGALVESLRRTRVGPFDVAAALALEADAASARARLFPLSAAVAELPRLVLTTSEVERLQQGQGIPLSDAARSSHPMSEGHEVAVFDRADNLIAVAGVDLRRRLLVPLKVLS